MSNGCSENINCTCEIIKCLVNEIKNGKECCWIQASGKNTITITESDTPTPIPINTVDGANNVELDPETGKVKVLCDGLYCIIAAPQVGRCECEEGVADFRCWLRKNGNDIPNSNVLLNLYKQTKDVIVSQGIIPLKAGDTIQVIMATDNADAGVQIETINPTPNEPTVPSIIFSLFNIC